MAGLLSEHVNHPSCFLRCHIYWYSSQCLWLLPRVNICLSMSFSRAFPQHLLGLATVAHHAVTLVCGVQASAALDNSKPTLPVRSAGACNADGGEDEGGGRLHNYRYVVGLTDQLRRTLLHLLSLAEASDGGRLRDAALKRAGVLRRVLLSTVVAKLRKCQQLQQQRQQQADSVAGATSDSRLDVAVDPVATSAPVPMSETHNATAPPCNKVVVLKLPTDPFDLQDSSSPVCMAVGTGGSRLPKAVTELMDELRMSCSPACTQPAAGARATDEHESGAAINGVPQQLWEEEGQAQQHLGPVIASIVGFSTLLLGAGATSGAATMGGGNALAAAQAAAEMDALAQRLRAVL